MKNENTFDNMLHGCLWFIIAVVCFALALWGLTSCAPVAEVYDEPMYLEGGCYEIRDTVIVDTFLIGRPCEY